MHDGQYGQRSRPERDADVERITKDKARIARGPYVIRRASLSQDEELIEIPIPDAEYGRLSFDTDCIVYRDLAGHSSSLVCPESFLGR